MTEVEAEIGRLDKMKIEKEREESSGKEINRGELESRNRGFQRDYCFIRNNAQIPPNDEVSNMR
jgi:hypothetical protein